MTKTFLSLTGDKGQGFEALAGLSTGATYSDSVRVDFSDYSLIYVSGKTGTQEGKLASRTIRDQARQVFENISESLQRHGASMTDIVRFRIFVTQIDPLSVRDIHEVRAEFFPRGSYPASTLVRVNQFIRDGALIEIETDAVLRRT